MGRSLTPIQSKVIIALAEYKFLTTSGMIQLGIATAKSTLSTSLSRLKEPRRALIKQLSFGSNPSAGSFEIFYFLSNHGKKLLIENKVMDEEDIKIPIGTVQPFYNDYWHRRHTLSCEIACKTQCEERNIEVIDFYRYFDKAIKEAGKRGTRTMTKFPYGEKDIIADATFLLDDGDKSRLYAMEYYNDTRTTRQVRQLKKHLKAIEMSSLCPNYEIKKGHRVLAVFTHQTNMTRVMEKFQPDSNREMFLFKMNFEAVDDFLHNWHTLDGDLVNLI